jgi:hypothetical protein
MDFTCANVVEYLPQLVKSKARLKEEGGPFDLIILDPPPSRRAVLPWHMPRRATARSTSGPCAF